MSWRPSWWLKFLKIYWPLNHLAAVATHLPLVGNLVTLLAAPLFTKKNFQISYIPVHARLEPEESTILTQGIIAELIRRSAHRVIIKRCTCRDAKNCQDYPVEAACLLLGEDTRVISSGIADHVSVDEALTHLESRVALGLIPMIGRVRMDDLFYGVPNRSRMLTICFCCPCCCMVLNSARYFPAEFRSGLVKLPGMQITVDQKLCTACGTCVDACFMHAIELRNRAVLRNEDTCIGCGRCVTVCPQHAASMQIDDCNIVVNEIMARITQRIQVE